MREYLEQILHQSIQEHPYESLEKLPLGCRNAFALSIVEIQKQEILIAAPIETMNLTELRKMRIQLERYTGFQCVFYLKKTNWYSVPKMVEEGIPFIWENHQIYLPFMGLLLQRNEHRKPKRCSIISFLTQKLLLKALYEGWQDVSAVQAAEKEYTDQYVLIGGAACSVSFEEQEINFGRTTKDLDIVLIVEARTKEFGEQFWKFIRDGRYRIRAKSNGEPQFYRFDKPEDERFPKMIELFSRTNYMLQEENGLTPIHIDDSVSSLSAILLNDAYYRALLDGREIMMGISVLKPEWIIPFKAKAWLDLKEKQDVDSSDIKKHRNDIIRILADMPLQKCILPEEVRNDMRMFIEQFDVTESELKNLRIRGTKSEDIKQALKDIYLD